MTMETCKECLHYDLCNALEMNGISRVSPSQCGFYKPAADVAEVVRCKDCEYWDAVKNPKHTGTGICKPPNQSLGGYCTRRGATKADDFCSQGKRGKS